MNPTLKRLLLVLATCSVSSAISLATVKLIYPFMGDWASVIVAAYALIFTFLLNWFFRRLEL